MANNASLPLFVEEVGEMALVETPGIILFFPSIMAAQPMDQVFNTSECICSDLQHEDYSPLYAWFNYIVIIIMLPSLSAFGVITNLVNVFVYSRARMHNSSNTYLLFLACSDFFVVVTGLFIFWIDSARSYIPQLVQAPYTTVYTLPFGYMAQSCSIYFTVAAAFDCYIYVCWRPSSKQHCTVRRARRIVACIVLCSVLYNSLRFPQFNLRHCIHEGSQEMIVEICPTTLFFAINTVYNVYLYMIVMTLLPFSVLLILNLLIVCRKSVDAQRKKRSTCSSAAASIRLKPNFSLRSGRRECGAITVTMSNGIANGPMLDQNGNNLARRSSYPRGAQRRQHHLNRQQGQQLVGQQQQAHIAAALLGGPLAQFPASLPKGGPGSDETITMIMVVVLFLCCNTLALIVNLIETFFEPDALLLNLLSDASNFLVIFNSSVNCVIYLIFNNDYREVFLDHFVRIKSHLQQRLEFVQNTYQRKEEDEEDEDDEEEENRMKMIKTEKETEWMNGIATNREGQNGNGQIHKNASSRRCNCVPCSPSCHHHPCASSSPPVWLSSSSSSSSALHHHPHPTICHHHLHHQCPCCCPLLLRLSEQPKRRKRAEEVGEEAEDGAEDGDSGCEDEEGAGRRQLIPTKGTNTPASRSYLAEVSIISEPGDTRNLGRRGDPSPPPHIYVRPLLSGAAAL